MLLLEAWLLQNPYNINEIKSPIKTAGYGHPKDLR